METLPVRCCGKQSSSLSAQISSLQTVCMGSGCHIFTAIHFAYMSFVHCCTTSLPPATQRVISASGHSNPVSCSSGFPLLTLYVSCLFSLKTMYCQLSPSREACVCSLLTIRSLTIFCCHSLLYSFWQHGFLDPSVSITMLKCRFRDPLQTS